MHDHVPVLDRAPGGSSRCSFERAMLEKMKFARGVCCIKCAAPQGNVYLLEGLASVSQADIEREVSIRRVCARYRGSYNGCRRLRCCRGDVCG